MQARATRVVVLAVVAAAVLTAVGIAGESSRHADPRTAAKDLVARLRAERPHAMRTVGSGIAVRSGRQWLAVARAFDLVYGSPTRVDLFRWSESKWRHVATVRGKSFSNLITFKPVVLTGSRDPDFAIQGCGAADTNCLTVISDAGGRWRAVPFEYGYGRNVIVNGLPESHSVLTMVDACSCAGGPTSFLYEAYRDGRFQPVDPPGPRAKCSAQELGYAAGNAEVPLLQFDRVACDAGWAIAVGSGAGFSERVVGLFTSVEYSGKEKWRALTVDNGTSLSAAPGVYDLPISLLGRLGNRFGSELRPMASAARLIARLQREHEFTWPQQNGIVLANGAYWLVAIVPARTPHKVDPPYLVAADVYRWSGDRWLLDGYVSRLPGSLNLPWSGGWITIVPARDPAAIAFARAGSDSAQFPTGPSKAVITNAGGSWHLAVAARRR
jgi:hypothetical protein